MTTPDRTADLSGQRVLVTGAANGIGRACARALAAQGCVVACADVVAPDDTRDDIEKHGGRAWGFTCDVSIESQVLSLIDYVLTECGGIDVPVHCAGIVQEKPLLDTTAADFDAVIAVNLRGTFLVGREVIRTMYGRGGRVILIASDMGHLGRERHSPYVASKHGVLGLTKSWAHEFGPDILVNAISPGPTQTAMLDPNALSAEMLAKELQNPLKRVAQPEEIAQMAVVLASDAGSFITGQSLGVNGGSVMP